jgi:tetratricopeptide (TPR) repeat protein
LRSIDHYGLGTLKMSVLRSGGVKAVAAILAVCGSSLVAYADARQDCFRSSGDRAIRACTEAISKNPNDAISYVNRAFEHVQKGSYDLAVADYAKAIAIDSNRWDAFQGRAWATLKLGKTASALVDAQRALQLKPDAAQALDTRAHVYEALGRRDDALADFRRALEIEPRLQGSRDGLKRLGANP